MQRFRCSPGDLAIVIYDIPEFSVNIGRVVQVRGPINFNQEYKKHCWLIRPVRSEPFWVDIYDDARCFRVLWKHRVEHPDDWLWPIKPVASDSGSAQSLSQPQATELENSLLRLESMRQGSGASAGAVG